MIAQNTFGKISPIRQLYTIEALSKQGTFIHKLDPLTKILVTFAYILITVSFDRYNISGPLFLFSYPILVIALAELPMKNMLSRLVFSLPFCLFMGLSGVLVNQMSAVHIGGFIVSYGLIAFAVILMRMVLTVWAVTILMATTPFPKLTKCLMRLHVPRIFILVIEMFYRYLGLLFVERKVNYDAYVLRSNRQRGVALKNSGSFVGMLFIRNTDRARRVYQAMKLRGYRLSREEAAKERLGRSDFICMGVMAMYLLAIRIIAG